MEVETKDRQSGKGPQDTGCLRSIVGLGLGLALGALAGIVVGLVVGGGIAMLVGVI